MIKLEQVGQFADTPAKLLSSSSEVLHMGQLNLIMLSLLTMGGRNGEGINEDLIISTAVEQYCILYRCR